MRLAAALIAPTKGFASSLPEHGLCTDCVKSLLSYPAVDDQLRSRTFPSWFRPQMSENSSPEHPLELGTAELNMHRATMRAVGLEFGAVELLQERCDFARIEHTAHPQ